MPVLVVKNWWILALRGAAAVGFGACALALAETSRFDLVLLFGVYALVDGLLNVAAAAVATGEQPRATLVAEGLVSVAAGLAVLAWPGITQLGLLLLMATWGVATGAIEIVASVWLRQRVAGERFLLSSGVASAAFGVLMLLFWQRGALGVLWLIGTYAVVFGLMLLALASRLRSMVTVTRGRAVGAS